MEIISCFIYCKSAFSLLKVSNDMFIHFIEVCVGRGGEAPRGLKRKKSENPNCKVFSDGWDMSEAWPDK